MAILLPQCNQNHQMITQLSEEGFIRLGSRDRDRDSINGPSNGSRSPPHHPAKLGFLDRRGQGANFIHWRRESEGGTKTESLVYYL